MITQLRFVLILCLILSSASFAQWQHEWSSSAISTEHVAGWIPLAWSGDQWEYRFYEIRWARMDIMASAETMTPQYSYIFSTEEQTAGNQIYSLGEDLTGDNITEFYVLAYHGTEENYRQSFKIVDLTAGTTVFQRNDGGVSFGYPTIWDVDDDGVLECTYARSDYPSGTSYSYEVFETGVAAGAVRGPVIPLGLALKQNYPNPFNPSTTIELKIDRSGRARLDIYNTIGQKVRTPLDRKLSAGTHSLVWNGLDDSGRPLSSGSYFYGIALDGKRGGTRKMILIK